MNRFDRLIELFAEVRGEMPDEEQRYVIDLLSRLRTVYDDNFARMSASRCATEKLHLAYKEDCLNNIGKYMRKFLGVYLSALDDNEEDIPTSIPEQSTELAVDMNDMEEQYAETVRG